MVSLLVDLDGCVEKDVDTLETGDLAESQKEVENCEDPGRQGGEMMSFSFLMALMARGSVVKHYSGEMRTTLIEDSWLEK